MLVEFILASLHGVDLHTTSGVDFDTVPMDDVLIQELLDGVHDVLLVDTSPVYELTETDHV